MAVGAAVLLSALPSISGAALKTETVEYKEGGTVLEGILAYDDATSGKRPGVVVFHDWKGVGPYVRQRAEQLAALGYVAFAADIYGKGVRPRNADEAREQAGKYKEDRGLMRKRAGAALELVRSHALADPARIAAVGYCFGGCVALELARSGADLAGTVSFHGSLDTPRPDDARQIKGKVLVLHGADDPNVPPAQVAAFQEEMRRGGVDWQMNFYGGAVHSFSNPAAGNDPAKGNAYDEKADRRSWAAMKLFFAEIFGEKPQVDRLGGRRNASD